MAFAPLKTTEISLSFSPAEMAQLEAFAALHGVAVAAFIQKAALEAAHIAAPAKNEDNSNALWMSDDLTPTSDQKSTFNSLLPLDEPESAQTEVETAIVKRGVVGEPSKLAKGRGPVWEIRRALGRERVHGLGWTREQLAFVMKLSVVGVRKMEHLGTSPLKSLEARQSLLHLAQTLEKPTPEILSYIQAEEAALSKLATSKGRASA